MINQLKKIWPILLIILLGFLIYANSLKGEFQFDDAGFIVNNQSIRSLTNPAAIWNFEPIPTRFLTFYTFALNFHFHNYHVVGYHVVNILIHITNTILVWWFMLMLFNSPRMNSEEITKSKYPVALLTALIFLTHPIATQVVSYIAQRFASLATLFYIFSMCLYVKGRLSNKGGFFIGAVISAILGMFSKEIVFTLPIALILTEFIFFNGEMIKKLKWRFFLPAVLLIFIVPLIWKFDFSVIFFRPQPSQSHIGETVSSANYLITQFRVIWIYIRLLFIPIYQILDYDFMVSKSVFELKTFLGFLGLVFSFWVAVRSYKKHPLIAFGMFWVFLTMLVESSIIPIRHVIFEHRVYLPSIGFCIAFSTLLFFLLKHTKRYIVVVSLIICIFSVLTVNRNKVWQTQISLWSDAVAKAPQKSRAYLNLGSAYLKKQLYNMAMINFAMTVKLDPESAMAYSNIGIIYEETNQDNLALKFYNKSLEINDRLADVYSNRGVVYKNLKEFDLALADLNQSIELNPKFETAYINRGSVYEAIGDFQLAFNDYNEAARLNPFRSEIYNNRGIIYKVWRQYDMAMKDYNMALQLRPDFAEAFSNRGNLYYILKKHELALLDFDRSLKLNSSIVETYNSRGVVHRMFKNYDLAI